MSQPFAFPPPPPPPPKRESSSNAYTPSNRISHGSQRGRGSFRGGEQHNRRFGSRERGHGQHRGSGSYGQNRAGHSQPNIRAHGPFASAVPPVTRHKDRSENAHLQLNLSPKRSHSTAFSTPQKPANSATRPRAPPAVPSFGLDLENVLPKKSDSHANYQTPTQRKGNLLGLTPAVEGELSGSENDEEEESRLAGADSGSGLQFEYRGQTSLLRTAAEIAAWLAERKKKWPTQERVDVAKREAEEKRKKWEAEKQTRIEASREAARLRYEQRNKERTEREKSRLKEKLLARQVEKAQLLKGKQADLDDPAASSKNYGQSKADWLRLEAAQAAEKLRAVEEALRKAEAEPEDENNDANLEQLLAKVEKVAQGNEADERNDDERSLSYESDREHSPPQAEEETSSSGSSDESDASSDSAPEVSSSKRIGPEQVLPPSRNAQNASRPQRTVCRNFSKFGRCRHGKHCRYLHERPDKANAGISSTSRRKSLYQVMVQKEQEEERTHALRAIISLGERGLLDEPVSVHKDGT